MGTNLNLDLRLGSGGGRISRDMVLVYAIPSAGTPIQLAIQANSTYFSTGQSVVIDWGDSSDTTVSATSGQSGYIGHTYADARTYTIKISGSMTMYGRSSLSDIAGQTLLTRIDSFGKLGITSLAYAFYSCFRLMAVPKTLPDSVREMTHMFYYCYGAAFNPDVSNWDMRNVTNISGMFRRCYGAAFNPDVSNWDMRNVTSISRIFNNCYGAAFNPDMKRWTLKTGVNTVGMFDSSRRQSTEWLDELLVAWAANPEQGSNITIDFSPNKFSVDGEGNPSPEVANALGILNGKGWIITTANPYSTPTP